MAGKSSVSDRLSLTDPVGRLHGAGPKLAEKLERLGIREVRDLLFHLPLRYQDRTRITPAGAALPGTEAMLALQVDIAQVHFGRRRSLLVRCSDGTGALTLRFFHFSGAQQKQFTPGRTLRCFGEVRRGPSGPEMVHPEYQLFDETGEPPPLEGHLRPVYPTTEGVSQVTLNRLTDQALQLLNDGKALKELLPAAVLGADAPSLAEAVSLLHRPGPEISLSDLATGRHPAQRRLAFEELLAHYLSLRRARAGLRQAPAPSLTGGDTPIRQLRQALPFALTGAQERVINEISADLARPAPMLRLLQGDVGSGKTIVAAHALLRAVDSGTQAAVMAPTELLAAQHMSNLQAWLEPLGIPVLWLAGRMGRPARKAALEALAGPENAVVIGTHALVQEDVAFRRLGLVIIDEQHRFGVHQRLTLQGKGRAGEQPHQLIMTATPIPRTLAMTAYAELDTSTIDELPPNRQPVRTVVMPDSRRAEIVGRIADASAGGRQIYWVCTLIEESEALQCQAADNTARELAEALPQLRVGLLHGRMKDTDKATVMAAFSAGDVDLLVATTVIEVGVDVPNASLMIIENAERLGLAQLHQLRGRVGRGDRASDCVLMYHAPLSQMARERLAIMRRSSDGFVIAEKDLELRGPGELLGTRQAGAVQLKVANLARDADLVERVKDCGDALLAERPGLAEAIVKRWLAAALDYIKA